MKQRMVLVVMMTGLAMAGAGRAQAVKTAAAGDPQVKDDLFDGTEQFAKNATDVTEVTMDPQTLGMVDGKDKAKAHHMRLNVVRTYTYDKPGMYDMAEVERFRNKLNTGDWHCSVHTRSLKTGNSTDVCQKTRTDGLVETAIMTVEAKQLTFVHTIAEKGAWGGSYGGAWSQQGWMEGVPMPAMGAVLSAEVAASSAEWKAQMAAMRPEMLAALSQIHVAVGQMHVEKMTGGLNGVKGLKVPDVGPLVVRP